MNFLPIVIRELQVSARRAMSYYWRSLAALNAACVTLGFLLVGFSGALPAASAGALTFQILSGIGYGIAALMAVLATSDCISEERRDGTLGFLFLTDLKGYDVILGKLARLGVPVCCLIATFPALGFTMLLGGISIGDFANVAIAVVNTLFFFAALGLLVSARSWDGRAAVSLAVLGVVLFSAPMIAALLGLRLSGLVMAFLIPTPCGAFLAAMPPIAFVAVPNFLLSLAVSHAIGWLFLIGASRAVTRTFSKAGPAPAKRLKLAGAANPSIALHAGEMARNPWKPVYLLAALVGIIAGIAALIAGNGWYDIPTFLCMVLAMHLIVKFWTAHCACRSLPSRRQSGELEILLTTPLDGDDILLGSTTAIKHQMLRPFLFVVAMDILLVALAWHKLGLWQGFIFACVMLVEFLWFIGNLYSLTWVGLWAGLKSSSHAKALGRTLFYILLLPWSVLAISAAMVGIMTIGRSLSPFMGFLTAAEYVMALGICNLGFTGWAVSELRDHFRLLAGSQALPSEAFFPQWKPFLDKVRSWRGKRAPQPA
ncbi:MAG TPA: ABC transporter permease subunit [Verrucomicrobiae bacterium]|jgi:hypothetical protein